jgi:hypothetical protein
MRMKLTRASTLPLVLGLAAWFGLGAVPAFAHGVPAIQTEGDIGGYHLVISQYADPAHVDQGLPITVWAGDGSAPLDDAALVAIGQPGLGTDATPTHSTRLVEEPLEPGSYAAEVLMPVAGAWDIEIDVDGPAGSGSVRVPVKVAAPAAIPVWLGWTIGLSPLLGIAWFARWNQRQLKPLMNWSTATSPTS